jgi:hypothetical protein
MQNLYTSARMLNPEAGEHVVSAHAGEQAAAEAATRLSWREFPYYAKRYGERGWRFSLSDSGWLETLCELSFHAARGQMLWLANLLAARGMPRYLLERHLEHLHAQLQICSPETAQRFEFLSGLSGHLREILQLSIPQPDFDSLANEFESRTIECRDGVKNMGSVLVAAVADDRGGIGSVLANVETWASDPQRFDQVWIEAVRDTIARARAVPTPASASVR